MNLFDGIQDTMFGTVTTTMGYDATWIPKAGGVAKTARVLYNGPTEKEKLLSADYDADKLMMEWKKDDLNGLFESAQNAQSMEWVTITGIGQFFVRKARRKFDGKTYEATLEIKPT